jgi:hypothetical protein
MVGDDNPKIRVFWWRIVHNAVAILEYLKVRKCTGNPVCPLCLMESESVEHVFLRCTFALEVWNNLEDFVKIEFDNVMAIKSWASDMFKTDLTRAEIIETLSKVSIICRVIWNRRNNWIFEKKFFL